MPYIARIWCNDCCGIDPEGCYGGGADLLDRHEILCDDDGPDAFATFEEAGGAMETYIGGDGLLEYEIVEVA